MYFSFLDRGECAKTQGSGNFSSTKRQFGGTSSKLLAIYTSFEIKNSYYAYI